jgi:histidine triad (HIT) family protein
MKAAYHCDGISTRQHNEPAGNQDVWHYHLHVFPRYTDDQLYLNDPAALRARMPADERAGYAQRLRAALGELEQ